MRLCTRRVGRRGRKGWGVHSSMEVDSAETEMVAPALSLAATYRAKSSLRVKCIILYSTLFFFLFFFGIDIKHRRRLGLEMGKRPCWERKPDHRLELTEKDNSKRATPGRS